MSFKTYKTIIYNLIYENKKKYEIYMDLYKCISPQIRGRERGMKKKHEDERVTKFFVMNLPKGY